MPERTIRFPPPGPLLSLNDRQHWAAKACLVSEWRRTAFFEAVAQLRHGGLSLPPCTVSVTLPVKGRRRRDPHNLHPTVKAVIDGLVDAGCWPDDTPEWVTTTEPLLEVNGRLVVVTLTERTDR